MQPWETDRHYFAKLATYAAGIKDLVGDIFATVYGFEVHVDGRVLNAEQINRAMAAQGVQHAAEIEEQIIITAHICEPPNAKQVMDNISGKLFNLIERGVRVPPPGARSRIWSVAHLPPLSQPRGWADGQDFPIAFNFEVIGWPYGTDLGKIYVVRNASYDSQISRMTFRWAVEQD